MTTQIASATRPSNGTDIAADERQRARHDHALRRRELADFLRSRRERIVPEDVGLPPASRRRTPGLRREEVATLAGVGVTWYTWLEQGRDINVSPQVLDAVARTLLLDRSEREHLFRLADAPEVTAESECQGLQPTVQVLLDQLCPYPASVRNARYDILAFNGAYERLMGPHAAGLLALRRAANGAAARLVLRAAPAVIAALQDDASALAEAARVRTYPLILRSDPTLRPGTWIIEPDLD